MKEGYTARELRELAVPPETNTYSRAAKIVSSKGDLFVRFPRRIVEKARVSAGQKVKFTVRYGKNLEIPELEMILER